MNYLDFQKQLKNFTIFSLNDIRKINPRFFRTRLSEWQKKGYIKKVIKGHYIFSDLLLQEQSLFEIANEIYKPSYVSLEMALAYHGLIPESVYGITSVSTLRTRHFKTPLAFFSYRTINPKLFFGYELIQHNDHYFKIALVEKAILDYFYLRPQLKERQDFESLRLNKDVFFNKVDMKKFYGFLKKFEQKSFKQRIKSFLEYIKHA